ncbi:MAG: hypothetical protein RLN89_11570 [Parvibaculum sp.]
MTMRISNLICVLCALTLAACAGKGDFGRSKTHEFSFLEDLGDKIIADANETDAIDTLPMTAEETQIRTLMSNVGRQASLDAGGFLERMVRKAERAQAEEETEYYQTLRHIHRDSGVSLLNAFGNDVLRDIALVDQFARLSVGVTRADAERLGLVRLAMENNRAAFSDAVGVVLRVEDNGKVIDQMADLMAGRLDQYAEALELAAFEVPEQGLVDTVAEALKLLTTSVKGVREDATRHRAIRGELFARRSSDLPI